MWSLGPHCHSLLRGYRFLDPQWEANFQTRCQRWTAQLLWVYVPLAIGVSVLNIGDFTRYWRLKPGLVLHFAICVVTFLVLAGTHCSSFLCRHVDPLFAGCTVFVGLCYSYTMWENIGLYAEFAVQHYTPELLTLPESSPARQQAEWFVRTQVASDSINNTLWYNFNNWVLLSLVGFNRYTLGSLLALYVSLSTTLFVEDRIRPNMANMAFLMLNLVTFGFIGLSIVMERLRRANFLSEALLTQEMQASQMADSMLNHTLKNLLADVAANIEVYLEGSAPRSALQDSVTCLRRGMAACKERQVYLKMLSGEYLPASTEVNLKEFGQQLVAGRAIHVDAVDLCVYLDNTICNLILENALSNAFRHGHPSDPQVRLVIETLEPQSPSRQGYQRIRFTVENVADPDRPPLRPEDVEQLFHGQAHLLANARVPTLSDHVGIVHCVMAAQLGGLALSLGQTGHVVQFTATVDVPEATLPTARSTGVAWSDSSGGSGSGRGFPTGLRFCCLDDSTAALRLLDLHLRKWCAPSAVHLLGHSEADVRNFVPFALQHADVVVVDQHLQFSQTYYGTDLVRQLCDCGFQGLLCIRSADDDAEDRKRFRLAGAHCSFGKDVLGSQMMDQLKAAYIQLQSGSALSTSSVIHPELIRAESVTSLPSSPAGSLPSSFPTTRLPDDPARLRDPLRISARLSAYATP